MYANCHFPQCSWAGDTNDLLGHCETYHKSYVRHISTNNGFTFTFGDIVSNTFLLCSRGDLYWFLQSTSKGEDRIRGGIFAIGKSGICVYTARIGEIGDRTMEHMGPYKTQRNPNKFDLDWGLRMIYQDTPTKPIQVFFDVDCNSEIFSDTYHNASWTNAAGEALGNQDPVEMYCNKYIFDKFDIVACMDAEWSRSDCRICTADIPENVASNQTDDDSCIYLVNEKMFCPKDPLWRYVLDDNISCDIPIMAKKLTSAKEKLWKYVDDAESCDKPLMMQKFSGPEDTLWKHVHGDRGHEATSDIPVIKEKLGLSKGDDDSCNKPVVHESLSCVENTMWRSVTDNDNSCDKLLIEEEVTSSEDSDNSFDIPLMDEKYFSAEDRLWKYVHDDSVSCDVPLLDVVSDKLYKF